MTKRPPPRVFQTQERRVRCLRFLSSACLSCAGNSAKEKARFHDPHRKDRDANGWPRFVAVSAGKSANSQATYSRGRTDLSNCKVRRTNDMIKKMANPLLLKFGSVLVRT